MSPDRSLQASFWSIILINTIGAVDMPGKGGDRKMPAPRVYVAIVLVWASLGLLADTGKGRAAAVIGWVLVGTSLIGNVASNASGNIGSGGTALVGFLSSLGRYFRQQQQSTPPFQGGTGGGQFSPGSNGTPGGVRNRHNA